MGFQRGRVALSRMKLFPIHLHHHDNSSDLHACHWLVTDSKSGLLSTSFSFSVFTSLSLSPSPQSSISRHESASLKYLPDRQLLSRAECRLAFIHKDVLGQTYFPCTFFNSSKEARREEADRKHLRERGNVLEKREWFYLCYHRAC